MVGEDVKLMVLVFKIRNNFFETFLLKVLMKHIDTNFREPNLLIEESSDNTEKLMKYGIYKKIHKLHLFSLPFDVVHFGTNDFFHAYCKNARQLFNEFKRSNNFTKSLK